MVAFRREVDGLRGGMTRRLRVLMITDSLAFPRLEPDSVPYEHTYVALLKDAFPQCDFIHHGRGGSTLVDLYKHSAYYHGTVKPDLVLMHSGVVDCAPRALTEIEQQVIARLPLLGPLLGRLVRRHSRALRRARRMTYTSIDVFSAYVDRFDELFDNVHWVGILPVSDAYEQAVNGMRANVARYNAVLGAHRFINTDSLSVSDIMSDFHHLNMSGHRKMFELLATPVRQRLAILGG